MLFGKHPNAFAETPQCFLENIPRLFEDPLINPGEIKLSFA